MGLRCPFCLPDFAPFAAHRLCHYVRLMGITLPPLPAAAVIRPCRNKPAPLFERIRTPVSTLYFIANFVRQRGLGDLSRKVRFVATPVSEARPETMHGHVE